MTLSILKKEIVDLYSTPIIQQTSFWSMVKKNQGVESSAFDSNARNRDLYSNVGGYFCTQADFVMYKPKDCIAIRYDLNLERLF